MTSNAKLDHLGRNNAKKGDKLRKHDCPISKQADGGALGDGFYTSSYKRRLCNINYNYDEKLSTAIQV